MNQATREQNIEQLEVTMDEAKKLIAKKVVFERLLKNKDFQEIFDEGYFKEEPSRLVCLRADSSMTPEDIARIDNNIIGIGECRSYLRSLIQIGALMENQLKEQAEALNELHGMTDEDYNELEG